jgi:hypothetical protein
LGLGVPCVGVVRRRRLFEFGGHGPAARIVSILLTLGVLSGPN